MPNKPVLFNVALTLLVWLAWYCYSTPHTETIIKENWPITLTMVFGSFIAGATSEGGGAVAFPVFTKLLHIAPQDAKLFSLAIQSVGMTAATLAIIVMRVVVAWRLILWVSLGGAVGVVCSSLLLAPLVEPALLRMLFTAMISSFALTLAIVSWQARQYHAQMPVFGKREQGLMLLAGIIGGGMTGLVGTGIDIICFSVMVLLFRLSAKVSTPTSVVIMAVNSLVGFVLYLMVLGGFTARVENYWLAAVPVVVVGAPFGAYCCTKMGNKAITVLLITLIMLEVASSLLLIPLTGTIIRVSLTVFTAFLFVYYWMSRSSHYRPVTMEK